MRDYKSTFGQPKKSRFRFFKLPLLTTALIAGAFYWLSQEPVNEVTQQTTTLQPLSLPGQEQVTPESLIIPQKPELITGKPAEPVVSEPVVEKPEKPGEEITEAEKPAEAIAEMSATWESHVIESGDTLAEIFKNWSLSASLLHKIVNSSKLAKSLADIHPGETIKLLRDDNSELLELAVERSPTETLLISRSEQGFDSEIITRKVDVRQAFASGTIDSSLFVDGQKSGLTDAQIMEMAGIFGWDIDFALELRKGDSFKLLYEEHYLDGEKYRNGPILAAEFENDGKLFKAVRYTSPDGTSSYYDPDDGRNKKKAFIRTPVKFARISSGFSNNRYHPKLKKWRAHRGVDYAAPTGTPIKAAGKGKVIFRGTKGGYGKTVILQHGSRYTTLYGHLSKYANAAKQGKSVAQGQIIGYVGQTGLATGPHLHYEFRVDGVHRNPLTVTLPKADPIDSKYRADFDRVAKQLMAQFKTFDSNTSQQIAQAPASSSDG